MILSFGLSSWDLLPSVLSLAGLFFIVPAVALKSSVEAETLRKVLNRVKFNPFSNAMLLFLGCLPLILVVGGHDGCCCSDGEKLCGAARAPAAIGMEWFFIMLPFSALLAPGVIFFFNFSAEAHVLMVKKQKEGGMRIAILGAGFAGLSAAWHLLRRGGCEVTLFDPKGVGGGASGIAAGLLHPYVGEEGKRSYLASEGIEATLELIAAAEKSLGEKVVLQKGIVRHTFTEELREQFLSHVKSMGMSATVARGGFGSLRG